MHKLKQFVVFLLSIGMFLSLATAKIVATDSVISTQTEESIKAPETLVGEISDKREVNIKTFLTSNNRYQAYIYPNAVHYKVNGKYQNIDNRLIEAKTDNTLLQNTANAFSVKFAKSTESNKIISFSSGTLSFSWSFEGLNKSFISFDNNDKSNTNMISDISATQSVALYSDAFLNTDIQYILIGDQLKENFILKAQGAPNTFTQTISIQQGSVDEKNGRLVFKDKDGIIQYEMGDLFMSDASSESSSAVTYSYVKTIQGIDLTIIADSKWINDPSRIYPITIDPSIQTTLNPANIDDAHVSSGLPNQQNGNSYIMKTGYGASSNINYSYMRFTLPTLSSSDLVISAVLMMKTLTGVDNDTVQVDVHEVTSSWSESTITYNNRPSYNSTIEDYTIVPENAWVSWDITRITKFWYTTKTNNGLMIRNNSDSSYYTEYYSADTGTPYTTSRPSIIITYVNTNGLEDLWTYTTQDIGRAGSAFVNNSTGNLTLMRDDISISGGKIPVGITSFYNYDSETIGARYSWKTNYNQTISLVTIGTNNYYKYIDGDGTAIYFYTSSGQWIDELGKGLSLSIDTLSSVARYIIKDKSGNTLEFDSSGYLRKLKDTSEITNSVNITYSSGLIDTITDSSGRKFEFSYASNRLTKIEYLAKGNNALRTVSYAYNDTNRTMSVTYPDTKVVTYYYDTEYKLIKAVDMDGSSLEFTYIGTPKIIENITEHATDGVSHGNQLTFSYTQYETKISDQYNQDVYYQFDNVGRTISIKDTNNAAQYYEYGATGGSQNKLTSVSKLQTTTIGLAKNISFETVSDWAQTDSSGTLNTPVYSTASPLLGINSLSITHPGDANRVIYAYQNIPVSLTETTSYTLSAYVKSSVVGAAHLSIFTNGNPIETSTDIPVDTANTWQRISATITITDTNVTSIKIMLMVDAGAIVYFDGIQVEEGVGVNRYNMVENPSLEYVTGTVPSGWTSSGTNSSIDYSVTTQSAFNFKSYKMTGSASVDKSLSQTIAVSGNIGDVFSYGGWAKALAVPSGTNRSFKMMFRFNNTDNTTTIEGVEFNNPSTAWQYVEGKAVALKAYNSVTISYQYFDQLNTVYFDGAQVYREEFGKTYSYDTNGNLISANDMEGNTDSSTYDSFNQLLKQTNADGTYVSYDYDFFHRVTSAQSSTGTTSNITYDVYGNPISTKIAVSELGNKLIAYYQFEGNMNDSSGNGYHGTNYAGTYETGKVDNAIAFNGTSQYGELGNFKVPEIFTMTMWAKNKRIASNECIIGKSTSTGVNQLMFGEFNSKTSIILGNNTEIDFSLKTLGYQFLVIEFRKVSATLTHIKVYKDTLLIYEADYAGQIGDTSSGKAWTLGMDWDSATKTAYFQGSVDELAFFKGELSASEIQALYDQANKNQLVAKYDFNTASGGIIVDNSVNGHNATYTGGVTFVSGAMVLNGSSGYMQLDDFTIGQDLSVVMTIKPDVIKDFSLFAKHDSAGNNILIDGYYYSGVHTRIRNGIVTGGALAAGVTKTLVYTLKKINGNQSKIQIYINGLPQLSSNYLITGVLASTSGKPWVIGQEWDGSNGSDFFDGTIDNLTIYNYEMSSSEVLTNATALTNGTYVPSSTVTPIAVNTYKTINASATYTSDGNYITSVTDSRGNSAYYDYNTTYGRLNSFRAPGEATTEATSYTYDANTDLVSSVSKTVDGKTYTNAYTYDLDKLSTITHNGFDYEFSYDSFNNPYQVKVAGVTLITNSYQANNGPLDTSTYGNGDLVKYEYDEYHRVITKKLDNITKFEYTYDNQGNLSRMIDHSGVTEVSYTYIYDFMNRLTKVVGSNSHNMLFEYDEYGRINMMSNTINGTSNQNEYVYGDKNVVGEIPGLIYNVKLNGTTQLSYEFDQLARLSTRTLGTTSPFTTTYTYLDGAGTNSTTTLLGIMTNGSNEAFNYTYDANGNILTISEGVNLKASYNYDKLNQLTREDNAYTSKSIDYVYDIGGNIVSRSEYDYTNGVSGSLIYEYDYAYDTSWKDQLISYDGQSITYDEIGNPLTYRDNLSFTWANGRELSSINNNGISTSYTYNDSGIRTSKTYNGVTTNYFLNGSSIVRQVTQDKVLDFFYDENGSLYGFKDDGDMYYYVRNGQSDIIGILDSTGIQVVYYQYDSWGNPLTPTGSSASTIGADNPFRYRGYYLDSETGLYYLNSRYYDSTVGRFINADGLIANNGSSLGNNIYVFCVNNQVNMNDSSGRFPQRLSDEISSIVGALYTASSILINTLKSTKTDNNLLETSFHEANRRPNEGDPGSTFVAPNGDTRTYDSNGKPFHDWDHDDHGLPDTHPHDVNGGHNHDWDWSKVPPRGDPYVYRSNYIVGLTLVTICLIGIIVVVANDITGVGIADDFMLGPLGVGVEEGLMLIMR